ncbi:MAG TPA: glycosyltransferase, partial [Caldithrix abyssi]|nr:glycosyltransferase [Caldithrix abyssi]
SGFKKFQQINRQKFVQKWKEQLKKQYENNPRNVPLASQRNVNQRMLICDPLMPMWDRASSSLRLFNYIKILKKLGNHITFLARVGSTDTKYKKTLQQLGIEVYENDRRALSFAGYKVDADWPEIHYDILFEERKFDLAILSFWYLAEYYLNLIRKKSPATKIIVDTVDIHFVRELREAQLKKDKQLEKAALENKEREIQVYRQADRLWAVTEEDRRQIAPYVKNIPVDIVPNIHQPVSVKKEFEQTSDLLFVGNFSHKPNVDAVQYFVNSIFPQIKKELKKVKFYIVGNNPPPEIQQLNREDIVVTGFVPDLKPYLVKARISVSPLRYGAGMKGKIGEALSYGLPVVTTSIGAEGMNLVHGKHALIADTAKDFAQQVVKLYKNQALWEKLSKSGKKLIEENWGPSTIQEKLQAILTEVKFAPKTRPKVSIIMLTYNALEYTKKCVNSILQHTRISYEIIFVDNGSKDGTVEYLKELKGKFGHIKVILNSKNRGFAGGNNQGAKRARGQYLLFLNNDVLVSDGWLENLVQALEKDPQIGMVGPVTNYISGLQRLANIPYKDDQGFHQFAARVYEINKNKITPRRRLAGFCLLMPKKLFEKVRGFDESFGTGNFEDDDLCLRVREKGFALMAHEGVFIHHYGSQSFKANNIQYNTSINQKSKIFFKKHPDVDYEELLELKHPINEVHFTLKKELKEKLAAVNFKQAEKICRQILIDNPLDDESWFYLALIHKNQQNYPAALSAVDRVLLHDALNPAALNLKGEIMLARKEMDAAKFLFELALAEKPDYTDAKRNLAHCLIENNEFEAGVK